METKRVLAQWPLVLIFALTAILLHVFTTTPQTWDDVVGRLSSPGAAGLAVCLSVVAGFAALTNKEAFWRRAYTIITGVSVGLLAVSVASVAIVNMRGS
jgi:type IV secretory pathway VirB2 component (pilin)